MVLRRNLLIPIIVILIGIQISACSQSKTIDAMEYLEKNSVDKWDLLWISDSSGWGVSEKYGEFISKDLDIDIKVNAQYGINAGELLDALNGKSDSNFALNNMRKYIEDSEIIVIYGTPVQSKDPENPWDWHCGQGIDTCYVNNCEMDSFDLYIDHLKEIYTTIYSIRKGKPTMLRVYDAYNTRLVNQCMPDGVFDECLTCWETYNNAIHIAADEMGVPIANVFDAWNGINHTEDPNEKGYVRDDGDHPNEKGAQVIASLLRDLGYEMTIP